ncbi:MAG: ATP-binding protein [Bacteroidia bacterium]
MAKESTTYQNFKTHRAEPLASSMIETFRAIGYNLQTAIADIIDNSVSAASKNIYVNFEWAGENSLIIIKDDGKGMNDSEIIEAMRPGSKSPVEVRDLKDLGRFGLGLKTASFSQCRKLTVVSKKENDTNYWTWDLDYVIETDKWDLIKLEPDTKHINSLSAFNSGTIVLWENIDRLTKGTKKDNEKDLDNFLKAAEIVKAHLAMVFHRYIEQNKIKLFFNDTEIEAWDPYLKGEKATQPLPDEPLANGKIIIKPYVLPHISKITDVIHKKAEGPRGWNAQQGFYIYRNERLLVAGEWLGMFRKEEHYKLARIMIDIPNTVDLDWQIDIKKSIARPPANIRQELKRIANYTRSEAVKIYRHRGKILQRSLKNEFVMLWLEKVRHGKRLYEVNREHPLIKELIESNPELKWKLNTLLRIVEETVPVPLITLNESEKPDTLAKPFEDSAGKEVMELLKLMYKSLIVKMTSEEAKQQLLYMEPFNEYPALIEAIDGFNN